MAVAHLRLALGLSVAFAAGCAGLGETDLGRLYDFPQPRGDQPPLIVIPGLMGSTLVNEQGTSVWPGSLWNLAFGDQRRLALEIDPETLLPRDDGLRAEDLFERVLGRDYYGALRRTLEGPGGYRRARPGDACDKRGRRYYVLAYDWRQDNLEAVRQLDVLIDSMRRDCADPDLKVDIVAHSLGGLIARYYLRYGPRDLLNDNALRPDLHGAQRVRRLILLGTPNLGAVTMLHSFLRGEPVGLRRVPTEVLATMPSLYQLFPHPLNVWLVTAEGEPLNRDLFSVRIWRRFRWSIFDPQVRARLIDSGWSDEELANFERYVEKHLERARRFVWSLTRDIPAMPTRQIVFGGDCLPTSARLVVEEIEGESAVRLHPDEVENPRPGIDYQRLMNEPGDGLVIKASLLARDNLNPATPRHRYLHFPATGAFFVCERHKRLTGNLNFRDNLLHVLLSADWP